MSEMTQTAEEQPIDELVGWVKQHDFSLNLPPERLAFSPFGIPPLGAQSTTQYGRHALLRLTQQSPD